MSFAKKIDEWMKEVEDRPESAVTIVRLVVKRLRELSEQNEELQAENLALQMGTRVEEYQKRIVHLEYQLEMLKQRFGMDASQVSSVSEEASGFSLLVYNAHGRILRIELSGEVRKVGKISGEIFTDREPPKLLAVSANENLLLLFTSGRVETCSLNDLPAHPPGEAWEMQQGALLYEPRAGETLVSMIPFSRLPLSEHLLQISRRGSIKKTPTAISESILNNHYLGKGTTEKSDDPSDLLLLGKNTLAGFVTYEGRAITFNVDALPYSSEESLKLALNDYVIGAFVVEADTFLLCVTQNGKVIQRESKSIDIVKNTSSKGQALIPPSRLEQGTRFMGAAAVKDSDQVAILDATGQINIHDVSAMTGNGSVQAEGWVLSMGLIHSEGEKRRAS